MPRPELSSRQRARLRGAAHALKPALHVGKEGVTDAAVRSAEQAFRTRELLKVRVLEAADEGPRAAAEALADRLDAAVVQVAGRTAVLYRPEDD